MVRAVGQTGGESRRVYTYAYSRDQAERFAHKRYPGWTVTRVVLDPSENSHRNPLLAAVLPNPLRRPRGVFRAPSGRVLLGDAVYEIRYRHAEDGKDYVHVFEDPENVRIEIVDDRTAVIRGAFKPIMEDV